MCLDHSGNYVKKKKQHILTYAFNSIFFFYETFEYPHNSKTTICPDSKFLCLDVKYPNQKEKKKISPFLF